MNRNLILSSLLVLTFSAASSFAADEKANEMVPRDRNTALQTPSIPAALQEDAGVIQPPGESQAEKLFRAGFHQDILWYSNPRLISNGSKQSDAIYLPAVDLAFYKDLGAGFGASAYLRQETLLYQNNSNFNMFGSFSQFKFDYTYNDKLPTLFVGCEPYRYELINSGKEITKAITFITGFNHALPLPVQDLTLLYGYRYSQTYSTPGTNNSTDHRTTLGLSYKIDKEWSVHAIHFYQFSDYSNVVREDTRNTASVGFNYQPLEWLSLRVSASFVNNDSNATQFEYQNWSSGAGSSMTIAF